MSVSILGGKARGFALAAPDSKSVRPTSALLKRRFFDSHQNLQGFAFHDVCAGSGSIGFEALSRGANFVEFVEASNQAINVIKKNKKSLKEKFELEGEVFLIKGDCLKWAKSFEQNKLPTIIFFDPPYENANLYKAFLKEIKGKNLKNTKLVVEFCRQKTAKEEQFQEWLGKPDKSYRQGTSFLYIYDFE